MLTTPGRTGGPDSVRRLNLPAPLRVQLDASGEPVRVWRNGRWQHVEAVGERYRVEDRWWTSQPVSREYFDLLLEGGQPLTIFEDRIGRAWYAQRYR